MRNNPIGFHSSARDGMSRGNMDGEIDSVNGWEVVVEGMRGNGAVRMVIRLKLMGKWSGGEGTQVMGWGGQG